MRADAAGQATLGQREDALLLSQHGLADVQLGVLQRQLDVGADNVALQLQLGDPCLGGGHLGDVEVALGVAALAAPEVERIAQAQGGVVVPGGGFGQVARAIEIVGRPAVAGQRGIAADLRRLGGLGDASHGHGHAHPRLGLGQGRAAVQRSLHPAIQLRIAIGTPPLLGRPASFLVGVRDGGVGGQLGVAHALFLRGDAVGADTSGDC